MNRLAHEASPYLRAHADNPVDWYPWSEEALARARAEDRPIFLSIGYAACHWCHVMARESFSDSGIAALLNDNFVAVKVDREERPDLDELYIEAVRLMTGSAGWPLSVFLTPELKPFYGGTYFPPVPRRGQAGFDRVLHSVLHYYRTERHEVDEAANRLTVELNRLSALPGHEAALTAEPLRSFYDSKLQAFDSDHGGFGIAPKFPGAGDLLLLLRLAGRPGFEQALPMVETTLRRMSDGGIHDQLGGGFHRYSTDTVWLVPHFEKMLYDNALLSVVFAEAYARTGDGAFRSVCMDTLAWLERDLLLPGGGFACSLDADSGGSEGACYLWTPAEVDAAVGPEMAPLARDFHGVTVPGHVDGRSVLHVSAPVDYLLQAHRLSLDELWQRLADIRQRLLAARGRRPAPERDDKVLADWNGLALSAFAVCSRLLGDRHIAEVARSTAGFINRELLSGADLIHFRRPGLEDVPAQLPDYAMVGQGLLDLYQATFEPEWLATALRLADRTNELFLDPEGGFFTAAAGAGLLCRVKNGYDGAIPSGNSVAVSNLLRLARLCGRDDYERIAADTVRRFYRTLSEYPTAFSLMLANLDLLTHPAAEVALFLPGPNAEAAGLRRLLDGSVDPHLTSVVVTGTEADPLTRSLVPLTQGRAAASGLPTAWVCRGSTCLPPVHTAADLADLLRAK